MFYGKTQVDKGNHYGTWVLREMQFNGTPEVAIKSLGTNRHETFPDGIPNETAEWTSLQTHEIITTHRITIHEYTKQKQAAAAQLQLLTFAQRKRCIMTKACKKWDMEGVSKIRKLKNKANKTRRQSKRAKLLAEKFHMLHVKETDAKKRDILLKIARNRIVACMKFNEMANDLWNEVEVKSKIIQAKVSEIMKLKREAR